MKKPASFAALLALALLFPALFPAFAAGTEKRSTAGRTVIVSILPQAYFVDRISGGAFGSTVLVGPGQSEHTYEPTPRQMAQLAGAVAWFTVGMEFEAVFKPKVAALYPKLL